jgi:aldehyde:ferredoxin oxidoreductase
MWAELFSMNNIFKDVPKPKMLYMFKDRLNPAGKAPIVAGGSKYMQLVNGVGGCFFAMQMAGRWPIIEYMNAATGWRLSPEQYLKIGERIQNLRQAFNAKHGLKPMQDFRMPDRAHGVPPLTKGPLKGVTVQRDQINTDFCKEMGWAPETAWPTRSKLEELGLDDVAKDLYG